MIPILFEQNETEFQTNGLGRLSDAVSCVVDEERNGVYELEMEYPANGQHYDDLTEGRLIYCRHSDALDLQPFRIYKITKPFDGIVTINARHISYDLNKIVVAPFTAGSAAEAMQRFPQYAISRCPFTFWTDKAVAGSFKVEVPSTIRSLLGGTSGSILDTFGTGEYEFDVWTVRYYLHRGADNGVTIRYGKNLTDIEQTTESDYITAAAPYWVNEDYGAVVLPEGAVFLDEGYDQPYTNELGVPYDNGSEQYVGVVGEVYVVPLDLSEKWEEPPTVEQLRDAAIAWLENNGSTEPETNIEVSFVQLWQTNEYKNIAPLQRVKLCDTVTVEYPKLGISAKAKVIRTEYDVLLERYNEMELGEPKSTLSGTIAKQTSTIAEVVKTFPSVTQMNAAINAATALITGGLGGHVVIGTNASGQPNEILIMDTDDMNTAVNVIRMNANGIGFSTTGYNGPFTSAWTIDGAFVADFITAGTLDANLLKAGIIMDKAGKNYWNLETGAISIDASSIPDAGVTQADLEKAMANAAADATAKANAARSGAVQDVESLHYITETQLNVKEGEIMTNVGGTYVTKADALSSQTVQYYSSTSPTTLSGGSWQDTPPEWAADRYIWQRTTTTKADGTTETKTVCIAGARGQEGPAGPQGPRGDQGENALFPYIAASRGTDVSKDETAHVNLRGIISDYTGADTDPTGTSYTYIWWYAPDGGAATYLGTGKSVDITIDGNLFDNYAGIWFETGSAADLQYVNESGEKYMNESGSIYGER